MRVAITLLLVVATRVHAAAGASPGSGVSLAEPSTGASPSTVEVHAATPALVHEVSQPGAQAKFPGICTYIGGWLVTAFSDQSDAFHEAGDTGQTFASKDGKAWSAVPNSLAPWILNGVVPLGNSTGTASALGFTYMLKGKPLVDAGRAYLQGYTLTATADGVSQTKAYNISLAFPPGHGVDPYQKSDDSFGMVVTGLSLPLKSGGILATLYGTCASCSRLEISLEA
jgi:hypothetical protein